MVESRQVCITMHRLVWCCSHIARAFPELMGLLCCCLVVRVPRGKGLGVHHAQGEIWADCPAVNGSEWCPVASGVWLHCAPASGAAYGAATLAARCECNFCSKSTCSAVCEAPGRSCMEGTHLHVMTEMMACPAPALARCSDAAAGSFLQTLMRHCSSCCCAESPYQAGARAHHDNGGAIAGAVLGGIAAIGLVTTAIIAWGMCSRCFPWLQRRASMCCLLEACTHVLGR
jgi:hypothetical protein